MKKAMGFRARLKKLFPAIRDIRLQRLLLSALIFAVLYLLLAFAGMPTRVNLELGRPSTETIYAPRDFIDEYTTEQLREAAAAAVPEVYDYDPDILANALSFLNVFFETAQQLVKDEELTEEEKIDMLGDVLDEEVPRAALAAFLSDSATMKELQERLVGAVTTVFEQGIKVNEVGTARRELNQEIALFPFSADLKLVAERLVENRVEPNLIYNPEATALKREAARQAVEPVLILRNTLLISEGEVVTEKQMAQLESLGLIRGRHADYPAFIGLFLLLLILFVISSIYLKIFVKNVYDSLSLLTLLGLVVIVNLVFSILTMYLSGYLMPVAMGVLLITVIFGYRLAVLMNLNFALLVGFITGGDFVYMLVALTGGMVAIYAVSRLSQRSDLAKAGLYVAAINMVVITTSFLLKGNLSLEYGFLKELGMALGAGVGNGLLSAVVAIGMLPYLESAFGVTTPITLLELSSPNHALLRELLRKAPGTYYHSMMVCNLAEAAAEAVKANPLLTRVGAYYHDIGKMKRPYFFSENQLSGENPHDKISPNLSALIIGAHVKDGLEYARKYRLPRVIRDIIQQHHGTSLISFFYQRAVEQNGADKVAIENFRYEGPLPQSKEAAIIMLADAVEAGVRSLSKPTGNRVELLIRRIIKDKLSDGQMDQCDLTLKELDQIGNAFVHIMSGIYHTRVEYPEKDLRAEIERSAAR
ncbi:MAG: HDIG domain-containing protein [Firmicutes bacterium]|jgi:putative nucleotidyltransferase with HDIG domain|nr:HDIG domain-containing protein [Bacillota bacterium]